MNERVRTLGPLEKLKYRLLIIKSPIKGVEAVKGLGDIVEYQHGSRAVYLLSHPDYVTSLSQQSDLLTKITRDIMLFQTVFGERLFSTLDEDAWRTRRALAQPAFHRSLIDT